MSKIGKILSRRPRKKRESKKIKIKKISWFESSESILKHMKNSEKKRNLANADW
jgi:hypothetical protein